MNANEIRNQKGGYYGDRIGKNQDDTEDKSWVFFHALIITFLV